MSEKWPLGRQIYRGLHPADQRGDPMKFTFRNDLRETVQRPCSPGCLPFSFGTPVAIGVAVHVAAFAHGM